MKNYVTPTLEVYSFGISDVITASTDPSKPDIGDWDILVESDLVE